MMSEMGSFSVPVEVGDAAGSRFESIFALVDTGAAYTWIPEDILARLQARPTEERIFGLADGREVTYGLAWLTIRIEGKLQPTPIFFGDAGTDPLLGFVTLEEFGLAIDPLDQRLIPVPALLKDFRG